MQLLVAMKASELTTDKARIATILLWISNGVAAQWAAYKVEQYPDCGFPTYVQFQKEVRQ